MGARALTALILVDVEAKKKSPCHRQELNPGRYAGIPAQTDEAPTLCFTRNYECS